ncbi:HAD family hydrolase [Pseudomonadota bacterium]
MSNTSSTAAAQQIRVVLFDLDGTLADTAPDLAYALNQTLERHDLPPLPYEQIKPKVSHGASALIRLGFNLTPDDEGFDSLLQELLRIYAANVHRETSLFPGMEKVLHQLEQQGIAWGIVTNKPSRFTDPLIKSMGLMDRAACVVSGDTTANSKPHPEPILHGCMVAGGHSPQECLYIGDAQRDIESGINAGTATLVALFGYLGSDDHPETWGATDAVEHPEQILEWLNIEYASE